MPAFNVVRFRVKKGQEDAFIAAHRKARGEFKGFVDGWLIKTGDRTFCLVAQWRTFKSIVAARPGMIKMLDQTRGMLEDLGGGLGVTDPVSGDMVARLKIAPAKKRAAAKKGGAKKPAAKKAAAKRKAPAKKSVAK